MKSTKKLLYAFAAIVGAIVGLTTVAVTASVLDNKVDLCCLMKKKAKKVLRCAEEKMDI